MILKSILPERRVFIEYRTHDNAGDDILVGFCKWTGTEMVPIKENKYPEYGEISSYEWDGPNNLIIWFD